MGYNRIGVLNGKCIYTYLFKRSIKKSQTPHQPCALQTATLARTVLDM